MAPDEKPDSANPSTRADPPKIYLAACGALCDIFWWARRDPAAEEPAPVKDLIP
jgi:hypothetical protein